MEHIGDRLHELRRKKRMSQIELAKKSGVCRAIISLLENGRREDVCVSTLVALARALDTTVDYFLA